MAYTKKYPATGGSCWVWFVRGREPYKVLNEASGNGRELPEEVYTGEGAV